MPFTSHLKTWQRLRLIFIGLGVALFLGILALSIWQGSQIREEIAQNLVNRVRERTRNEFQKFLGPIDRVMLVLEEWGRDGLVELSQPDLLLRKLRPLLQEVPHVASIVIADDRGRKMVAINLRGSWALGDSSRASETPEMSHLHQYPWFSPPTPEAPRVSWIQPYRLPVLDESGLSGAVSWKVDKSGTVMGAACHVLVKSIYDFIEGLEISPGGRAYLVNPKGEVLRRIEPGAIDPDPDRIVQKGENHPDQVLVAALEAWLHQGTPLGKLHLFQAQGENWCSDFRPLDEKRAMGQLGILIPERDFAGQIHSRQNVVIVISAIFLLLVFILIFWLLRHFRRQLADRAPWMLGAEEVLPRLADWIQGGESAHQEFKSTIRINLHTGKPGKEIELAWLKGVAAFLNSEGGLLFFGLDDEGRALGLEADGFESEDHCQRHVKNLISQHIGTEFSSFVHFMLTPYQEQKIGLVVCRPAPMPAFLKHGQKEEFYIRNGPASVSLTISQALSYLGKRKGG